MKQISPTSQSQSQSPPPRPEVIAVRKTCDATGTGLSHYVLMDQEKRR